MSRSRLDGSPYTQQATSPSLARGSPTTKTGTPQAAARARPTGSVSTATAPEATAAAQNSAPCTWVPGNATYRSPGRTTRESRVTPEAWPRSFGKNEFPTGASRIPSSGPSSDSGRGGVWAGRIATGRGYLQSSRVQAYVRRRGPVRRDLQRGQRVLHHLIEDRTCDDDTEVAALARVLHVYCYDQLRVVAWRHANVARSIDAQGAGSVGFLRSSGLGGDRVPGNDAPGLAARGVDGRHLLHDLEQFVRRLGLDDAPGGRGPGRGVGARGVRGALDQRRADPDAAVRYRRVDLGHLQRGDRHALAERQRVPRVPVPLRDRGEDARALPGQPDARQLAEAERPQVVVLDLLGDVGRNLGDANVGGVRDDAGDGEPLPGPPLRVHDALAALVDRVRDVVGAHRRLPAALERGRGGHHLGGGARLEDVLHGDVRGLANVRDVRGVIRRPLRQGQHVPGVRLDDHDRAVARVALGDLRRARLLGRVLQRGDDGQAQVAAVHHRLVAAARERDRLAVVADLHLLAARAAGQQGVVGLLQAGAADQDAVGRGAGEADDVGRDGAVGVGPGVARRQVDARQVEGGDLVAHLRGYALGQHHVLLRGRVLDLADEQGRGRAQEGRELGGDLRLIGDGDLRWVGVDQVGLHRYREHLPVRRGDAAAQRRQDDRLVQLLAGQVPERAGLDALELHEPPGEQRQHEDDGQQRDTEPPPRVTARDAPARPHGRYVVELADRLCADKPVPFPQVRGTDAGPFVPFVPFLRTAVGGRPAPPGWRVRKVPRAPPPGRCVGNAPGPGGRRPSP